MPSLDGSFVVILFDYFFGVKQNDYEKVVSATDYFFGVAVATEAPQPPRGPSSPSTGSSAPRCTDRIVVNAGEASDVELELSSSAARSRGGFSSELLKSSLELSDLPRRHRPDDVLLVTPAI